MQRPVDPGALKAVKRRCDRAIASVQCPIKFRLQTGNGGAVWQIPGVMREHRQPFFRFSEITGQKLTLRPVEFQSEGKRGLAVPTPRRQQLATGAKVDECRGIRRRILGPPASNEIEFGDLLSLLQAIDQRCTAIELIDDLEDIFLHFLGRHPRYQQSADSKVYSCSFALESERIGCLLHPVVEERIGATLP